MAITLPHDLTSALNWIGMTWPEANEDLLRDAGNAWIRFADQLDQESRQANVLATGIVAAQAGPATDAFAGWWNGSNGPKTQLRNDIEAARLIGAALLAFAAIIVALKLAYIAQLVQLAEAIGAMVLAGVFTMGVGAAAVATGEVVATRLACREALAVAKAGIERGAARLLEKASAMLSKGAGRKVATDAAETGAKKDAEKAVGEAAGRDAAGSVTGGPSPKEPITPKKPSSGDPYPADFIPTPTGKPGLPQKPSAEWPQASHDKLNNRIKELYKGSASDDRTGDGTTMDAIRNEILTGEQTGGRWHFRKGHQEIVSLNNWLERYPEASPEDRAVAQRLIQELQNALKGQ